MRPRARTAAACAASLLLLGAGEARARNRFGMAGGVLVPMALWVDGRSPALEPGPVLTMSVDALTANGLEIGGFLNVASFTAGERNEQVSFFDLGAGLHARRPLPAVGGEVRFGGGLGFRRFFADHPDYDGVRAVALNGELEIIKPIPPGLTGRLVIGALSQPWGNNEEGTMLIWPMPYLALGAVF